MNKESEVKRIISLRESWKQRKDYLGDIKNSYLYNSWRSFMFTKYGIKQGHSEEWNSYKNFYSDMISSYEKGMILTRKDKNLPFSKENCVWMTKTEHDLSKDLKIITYNGVTKSAKEWSLEYQIPLQSILQRMRSKIQHSEEELIFGRKWAPQRKKVDISILTPQQIRSKASKMISSYQRKDKFKNRECDIDVDWFLDNILFKQCSYCDSQLLIGCDRVDNSIGHLKSNVIPCCYRCNATRNNSFSFEEMKQLGEVIKLIDKNRLKNEL